MNRYKAFSKPLALLLAVAMIFTAAPITAMAEGAVPIGDSGDSAAPTSATVDAFAPLDFAVQYQEVPGGAKKVDLNLPAELAATVDGEPHTITGVDWACADYDEETGMTAGEYEWTAILPEGCIPSDNVELPVVFALAAGDMATYGAGATAPVESVTISQAQSAAEIKDDIQAAINTANGNGGGTVTVTGSKSGVDSMIELNILSGVTVVWKANCSGTVSGSKSGLIKAFGSGIFEVASGGTVNNTNGMAIFVDYLGGVTVMVSGGTVSSTAATAIYADDVIVSGGTVSTASTSGHYAINATNATVRGGTVSATGTTGGTFAIGAFNVTVNGGTVSAKTGTAIQAATAATVDGGFVFAYGTAIAGAGNVIGGTGAYTRSDNAVVVAWDHTQTGPFHTGDKTGLTVDPASTAVWAYENSQSGIRYTNGANTGFFPMDGVTVTQEPDGQYSAGDVAVINAIIENNGLLATKDAPDSWDFITWDESAPKRVAGLYLYDRELYGALDLSGLSELTELLCSENHITALDVTGNTKLERLHCQYNDMPLPDNEWEYDGRKAPGITGMENVVAWNTEYNGILPQWPSGTGEGNDPFYYYPQNVPFDVSEIAGVTPPVVGETPVREIDEDAGKLYVASITWSPAAPTAFAYGTVYTATITLAVNPGAGGGYTFYGVPENFFTIEGATSVANPANSGVITAVFPKTESEGGPISSDATLRSLTISEGMLTPAFQADTTSYTVTVANTVSSIDIAALSGSVKASVAGVGTKTLTVGKNTFDIVVTAEDQSTKTYTITVTREGDATLKSLSISEGTLSPGFSANKTSYAATVANNISSIAITAVPNDAKASVSGAGTKNLDVGENNFDIVVTAEGSGTKTYRVTVTREALAAVAITGEKARMCTAGEGGSLRLVASGTKPITWSADSLPDGFSLDGDRLTAGPEVTAGPIGQARVYDIPIRSSNPAGELTHTIHFIVTAQPVVHTVSIDSEKGISAQAVTVQYKHSEYSMNYWTLTPTGTGAPFFNHNQPSTESVWERKDDRSPNSETPSGVWISNVPGWRSVQPNSTYDVWLISFVDKVPGGYTEARKVATFTTQGPPVFQGSRQLPAGAVGRPYTTTLQIVGTEPFTWKLAEDSDALPNGLTLNDGAITGTPTAEGDYTFKVVAANRYNPSNVPGSDAPQAITDGTATQTFTLTVTGSGTTDKHPVTVYNGAGGGNYEAGATVTISAGTAPTGMRFKNWTVNPSVTFTGGTGATDATAKFTMPAQAVTATANFEAIPATVTGVTVNPAAVTVQKGTTYQFSATVQGINSPGQGVSWTVNSTSGSTISAAGLLTVAAGETAATLTVTATSTVDGDYSGTATITVSDTAPPAPTVSSVTVTPASITLNKGDTHQFSAAVTGTNNPEQGVIWTVEGGVDGTTVTNGILTVAADETASTLTVRATSTVNGMKSGTATVTVAQPAIITHTITARAGAGGSISPSGSVMVNNGASQTFTITANSGYKISQVLVDGSNVGNVSSYTFTGVTANHTIHATFESTGGGNGGGGGGGGSSTADSNTTWTTTVKSDTNMPVTATVSIPGTVDKNGNLSATVTEAMVKNAIEKAQAEARRLGKTADGIVVEVSITATGGKSLNIKLDQTAISRLGTAGAGVSVKSSIFRFALDAAAVKQVHTQSSGAVTFIAMPTDKLSATTQAAIGSRPVYDFTAVDSKGKAITSYGNGTITRGISYTPSSGEKTGNLFAVKVLEGGNIQWITESSYESGWLLWTGSSNSVYGVGYKTPTPAFTDTGSHWAKDNIDFAVSRGLFSGTSSTTFSPDTAITRGMFVTALGRLSGQDVSGYTTSSFTDVKAGSYYLPYIEWAVKNKIVEGVGNNQFAPDKAITREEMAVMIYNYAKATKYTLPASREAVTFTDNAQISSWAKEAVKTLQQAGIVSGVGDGRFNPKGTATRAEAATILRNFVEGVIDESTARGWARNDAGQSMYWTWDGKLHTGWLNTTAGNRYYFDQNGIMVAGKWVQIGGKWYYFQADGKLAVNTTIDGYEVGADGARKE